MFASHKTSYLLPENQYRFDEFFNSLDFNIVFPFIKMKLRFHLVVKTKCYPHPWANTIHISAVIQAFPTQSSYIVNSWLPRSNLLFVDFCLSP